MLEGTSNILLRREIFGGTLLIVNSGKRLYVTTHEFDMLAGTQEVPQTLVKELGDKVGRIVVREPAILPTNNFSGPDGLYLELTRACNLECLHCLNNSGRRGASELSLDMWAQVVSDAATAGVQEVRFTGGEPLVFIGLVSLIEQANSEGLRTSIGTNGVLVTDTVARLLANAGLNCAIVSIDGLKETHDAVRGTGNFEKTLVGMRCLRARGIETKVNITVMKRNVKELPDLVELLSREHIRVNLRRFIPSGRGQNTPTEHLSGTDYNELRTALRKHVDGPRQWLDGHYLTTREFRARISLPFERKSCRAGHRGLAVMPNGETYTCGFLAQLGEQPLGQLPKERLGNLWQQVTESNRISDMEERLVEYNHQPVGPATKCLAMGQAFSSGRLVQIRRNS